MPRKKHQAVDAFIGARVRLRLLMLGMSQEELSNQLGVTFQQVQKYEKGVNRISASRLFELSQAFDVPVQFFFDGLEEPLDPYPEAGLAEEPLLNPYLDFVSSGPGVELNRAFLEITDEDLRRQLLSVVSNIARVNRTRD
ncbi:MAG: helix-turn-helix transcriptional regulator [Alphaproteobacteria bacterium]|nr:helix-turn-helix transcriptional regulator [Alphaproteobacteria bacterium]